jgi:8-oxo-dGTP pyrophosphatase MutT (NUDIX family)
MKQMLRRSDEEMTRRAQIVGLLKYVPDAFLTISLGAIIVNDLIAKFFGVPLFDSVLTIQRLAAPIVIAVVAWLWRMLSQIKAQIDPLTRLAQDTVEVLPGDGAIPCADLMRSRSQIDVLTLAGSVTVPLDDEQVVNALFDSRRMSRVRCLIANPFAEPILGRYQHDEPIWKRAGTQAIEDRLVWLYNLYERLDSPARERLLVRVYDNYPMLSIFRADDAVYSSYYAYQLRGNETPVLLSDQGATYGRAVMRHFEKLYEVSTPLPQWLASYFPRLKGRDECQFGLKYSGVFVQLPSGKIAMQHRDNIPSIVHPNLVSVFGGTSMADESPIATAIRELREETDIHARERDLRPIAIIPEVAGSNDVRCMLCHYYLLHSAKEELKANEGQGVVMGTAAELLQREDLTAMPRALLQCYVENGNNWPCVEAWGWDSVNSCRVQRE